MVMVVTPGDFHLQSVCVELYCRIKLGSEAKLGGSKFTVVDACRVMIG